MFQESRERCPDCYQCQMCAESRCIKCREGGHPKKAPELGTGFTHGEYLRWRQKKQEAVLKKNIHEDTKRRNAGLRPCLMTKKNVPKKRAPVIDLSRCTDCESCLAICPSVFRKNEETGFIEVIELNDYPEQEVHEAVAICPADCITWETA